MANKLKETITSSPLDYLWSKGFLLQPRTNPNEIITMWLFGAMLKNYENKGFKLFN
jgi:hypothetical protein